jgi:hypothetical protein
MLWRGVLPCEIEEEEEGWKEAQDRTSEMSIDSWRDVVKSSNGNGGSHGLQVLEWGGMEVKG